MDSCSRTSSKLCIHAREHSIVPAAQLHMLRAKDEWTQIRKTGHELRGGDRWGSRGEDGVWRREHTTPRVSLFTPYKVAKGPGAKVAMAHQRITYGVTKSGKKFEMTDDWTLPDRQHLVLAEPWVGHTIFVERPKKSATGRMAGPNFGGTLEKEGRPRRPAWADVYDDEE